VALCAEHGEIGGSISTDISSTEGFAAESEWARGGPVMHHFDWLTASRKLRFVHLVSTDTRACIDCSEQRPRDRPLGDFEPLAIQKNGCQPAFRVGPTVGPLSVSHRSKCYLVLLKVTRKLLTLRSLQTCQGSGVGSIPIGRSILSTAQKQVDRLPSEERRLRVSQEGSIL
jgi:hypothetical protein